MRRLTTEEFINKAKVVHGERYDYSRVDYKTALEKVTIICPQHGSFEQVANYHIQGNGCPLCARERGNKIKSSTTAQFIMKARKVHGDRYDYSQVDYHGATQKVRIICLQHGVFWQKPHSHLDNVGCPECGNTRISRANSSTTAQFIMKARKVHGDRYDYSQVDYKNQRSAVAIVCDKHGLFFQTPSDHLKGHGCKRCKQSAGEFKIEQLLDRYGITYEREKRFENCRNSRPLPFDFYFVLDNTAFLVEYDGAGHHVPIAAWDGRRGLSETQRRDAIKTAFAEKNGFILIRVPYTVHDIENHLQAEVEKHLGYPLSRPN